MKKGGLRRLELTLNLPHFVSFPLDSCLYGFDGDYEMLNMEAPFSLTYDGYVSRSVEAAYYKYVNLPNHWDEDRTGVMYALNKLKFQRPDLRSLLLSTMDWHLVYAQPWEVNPWGVDMRTQTGENLLGNILMRIRRELRVIRFNCRK